LLGFVPILYEFSVLRTLINSRFKFHRLNVTIVEFTRWLKM